MLDSVEENLKQLFIVSGFKLAGDYDAAPSDAHVFDHVKIAVKPAEGETCERCWVVTTEVGSSENHKTLCSRCAAIVDENYTTA